jgi:PAS domain-containing protein
MNLHINEAVEKTTLRWTVMRYTTIFLFTAFCIVLLVFITHHGITNPLRRTALAMEKLAAGDLSDSSFAQGLPEIQRIDTALVHAINGLKEKAGFARTLNEGNLLSEMNLLGEHDLLGRELSQLQQKIRETADLQKRNDEATMKRRYINEGLAKFADILRTRSNDINLLGDSFIREIVKYLGAIQGGFFMLNDSDPSAPVLELVSAFAYNRKKYLQKSLALGEGLVGTCAKEKQTINLTEIPDGYISITSGLGDTRPNNLLLLPVMHDNLLIGVLEIASLRTFMEHEIQFALEVGGSLGSTIIYTRNNERTSRLLEKSQQQALEMAEQEEEMRQNMEELKATQEESTRREEELRGIAEAISHTHLVIEYDLGGSIRQVNDRCCLFFGRTSEELVGKMHPDVFEGTLVPDEQFWNTVEKNNLTVVHEKVRIGKMEYPLKEHFTAVMNRDNLVVKYINFITPLSETYAS